MKTDYDRLLEDAKARLEEAQADVDALGRVRRMERGLIAKNGQTPESPRATNVGRGKLRKAIQDFIVQTHGTFTMIDVFDAITKTGEISPKKQSVKAAL